MSEFKSKRLLVLGGTAASYDLVRLAKEMGIYTIVTDDRPTGVTKEIADETAMVSTADIDGLVKLCQEKQVDGVFAGPSEFNLRNVIQVCEKAGYPCYTDMQTWTKCANKNVLKQFCRQYGVDCPPEYDVSEDSPEGKLMTVEYPVIVKPVDGSSSAGVTVCQNSEQLRHACAQARRLSASGKIIVEQYIDNGGEIFSARYLLNGDQAIPYLLMDDYIVDPVGRTSLISGFLQAPSKYSAYYMEHMDAPVRRMLYGMGLRKGCVFFQALPHKGKLYVNDLGFRLSGGMIFKVTQPLLGINDMKMMIRTALGEPPFTPDDVAGLDLLHVAKRAGQLTVPLMQAGTIGCVEGLELCKQMPGVLDVLEYYHKGETIATKSLGTLGQLFCRFTLYAETTQELVNLADKIQKTLRIYDTKGNRMNTLQTDFSRMDKMN